MESVSELQQILQEEWAKVMQKQIQDRIGELPDRCRQLRECSGGPIKLNLWYVDCRKLCKLIKK